MAKLKVLCIHGIGGKDIEMNDEEGWTKDWRSVFTNIDFTAPENIQFMKFDTFFGEYDADISDYCDFLQTAFRKNKAEKGIIKDWFDNFPDMAVEFLLKESLRKDLRKELKKKLSKFQPDVIFAHSLGSIMCYDFFTQPENNHYTNIILVTAGSQLGNPRLKNFKLKQPLELLPVKFWYNLNNPNDEVLAKYNIVLPKNKNYEEVLTEFFAPLMHHDGFHYLNNPNALEKVWKKLRNTKP